MSGVGLDIDRCISTTASKNRLSQLQLYIPTNQLTPSTLLTSSPLLMAARKALKSPALAALSTSMSAIIRSDSRYALLLFVEKTMDS